MRPEDADRRWRRLLELLAPVHDRALATARRLSRDAAEGDDLFQSAVLRAFHKLEGLRDPERFPAWFFAVLLSVHRNRSRRDFWKRLVPLEGREEPEPVGQDGAAQEDERQATGRAARALSRLPAVQREAVVLFEIEGYSVREIAGMQRTSESAVKSRLARGRARLRRHYRRMGLGDPRPAAGPREPRLLPKGGAR